MDLLLLGGPGERVRVREKDLDAEERVEESKREAVLEGDAPRDNEAVGVGVGDAVPEPVGLGVGVCGDFADAVTLGERELLGVMLGLAPVLRVAVGDTVTVKLAERVVVKVPEEVRVLLGVHVAVGVCVGVPVEDSVTLAEVLGLAPGERVAVGDVDTVEL